MTGKDSILTTNELEALCHLYMECKLSVFEEMELEYVLSNFNIKTPIIQDVKKIMGLEITPVTKSKLTKTRRIYYNWVKKISWIAASIILVSIIGVYPILHEKLDNDKSNTHNSQCIVYSNGVLIKDEQEAISIAEKNLRRIQAFENKMELIQIQEKEKVDKFNKITMQ